MKSIDILYYSLAFGFIVLVLFLSYASYQLARTLKNLQRIMENVDDLTTDVSKLKNILKVSVFGTVVSILSGILRRRR